MWLRSNFGEDDSKQVEISSSGIFLIEGQKTKKLCNGMQTEKCSLFSGYLNFPALFNLLFTKIVKLKIWSFWIIEEDFAVKTSILSYAHTFLLF
jgi:hypothetical protein